MELSAKRRALEQLTQRSFARVYLAGSSAGAYFVAALAMGGELDAAGFGVLSGGSDRPAVQLSGSPRPVYIGFGTQDSVGKSARGLAERLRNAGWPVQVAAHPGGHGAKEVYLDEAFAFWRAQVRP